MLQMQVLHLLLMMVLQVFQMLVLQILLMMILQVLQMMVGGNLTEEQLQQVVNRTLSYADKKEDGGIDFTEFSKIVGKLGVHRRMVVEV